MSVVSVPLSRAHLPNHYDDDDDEYDDDFYDDFDDDTYYSVDDVL